MSDTHTEELEQAIGIVEDHMGELDTKDFADVKAALSKVLAAATEFLNQQKDLDEADEAEDKGA